LSLLVDALRLVGGYRLDEYGESGDGAVVPSFEKASVAVHPKGKVLLPAAPLNFHMEQYPGVFSGDQGDFGEDVDEFSGVGRIRGVSPGEAGEPSKLGLQETDGFAGIGNLSQIGKDGAEHVVKGNAQKFLPEFVFGASFMFVVGLFRLLVVGHAVASFIGSMIASAGKKRKVCCRKIRRTALVWQEVG